MCVDENKERGLCVNTVIFHVLNSTELFTNSSLFDEVTGEISSKCNLRLTELEAT